MSATNTSPIKEATSSLDPFVFDDDLIPYSACCCTVDSLFLRTPDCFGGHGLSAFLCCNQEFTCCKPGRHEEEYVIVNDGMFSLIKPKICCKGAQQVFCCDRRFTFLSFESKALLDPKFPCLVNCFGLTLIHNYMFTPMCCKKWSEIKGATGTPLFKKNDDAAPAPAATKAEPAPVEKTTTSPMVEATPAPVEASASAPSS